MKRIEQKIKDAWEDSRKLAISNTHTDGKVMISMAGWETTTTKSRLRSIAGADV